jgi:hypothetical protein
MLDMPIASGKADDYFKNAFELTKEIGDKRHLGMVTWAWPGSCTNAGETVRTWILRIFMKSWMAALKS